MAAVTIYTKPLCPYCVRALGLLERKGAEVTEIEAAFDANLRAEMLKKSGGAATYPQIFIGDRHVGGCDDLHDLEAKGRHDTLLAG